MNVAYRHNTTDISRKINWDSTESVYNLLDGYYSKCYLVQSFNDKDDVAWQIDLLEIHSIDVVRLVVKNNVTSKLSGNSPETGSTNHLMFYYSITSLNIYFVEFRFGVHVSVNESDLTEMQSMAKRPMKIVVVRKFALSFKTSIFIVDRMFLRRTVLELRQGILLRMGIWNSATILAAIVFQICF